MQVPQKAGGVLSGGNMAQLLWLSRILSHDCQVTQVVPPLRESCLAKLLPWTKMCVCVGGGVPTTCLLQKKSLLSGLLACLGINDIHQKERLGL